MESLKVTRDQLATLTKDHDLIKKLEALFDGVATLPAVDTTLASLAADIAALQAAQSVDDSRITTGSVNRTETVLPLNVGQTAEINWACGITGGVTRTVFFALPAVGQYQMNIMAVFAVTNTISSAAGSATAFLTSSGSVGGGGTAGYNCPSGQSINFVGKVKRIS